VADATPVDRLSAVVAFAKKTGFLTDTHGRVMSEADPWISQWAAPSTAASPSEMQPSLAVSGSEDYKAASEGSEGKTKPGYPTFGPEIVVAAPALMGSGAASSSTVENTIDLTLADELQFAMEFVATRDVESGAPYASKMQKREPSVSCRERRVGPVAAPLERASEAKISKRKLAASPRGKAAEVPESDNEILARHTLELESLLPSHPVPTRSTPHRSIAGHPAVNLLVPDRSASSGDRPPIYTPMSTFPPSLASTGQRIGAEANNGSHIAPAQAESSGSGAARASHKYPIVSQSFPTPPGGPYRPPPGGPIPRPSWSSVSHAAIPPCSQCPIHVQRIYDLEAAVKTESEDCDCLRKYIGDELEAQEERIEQQEHELNAARLEEAKAISHSESLHKSIQILNNNTVRKENEYKDTLEKRVQERLANLSSMQERKYVAALHSLRGETGAEIANLNEFHQSEITNLNKAHQSEINTLLEAHQSEVAIARTEAARHIARMQRWLVDSEEGTEAARHIARLQKWLIDSEEGARSSHAEAVQAQIRCKDLTLRVSELEASLAASVKADDTGLEEMKQMNAVLTLRINARSEKAEAAALLRESEAMKSLRERLIDAEVGAQRLIEVQFVQMQSFEVLNKNLEIANTTISALVTEKAERPGIFNARPDHGINGNGTPPLIDPLLFKKVINRCRAVSDEVSRLKAKLAESEGSQTRERDLRHEIYQRTEMVKELQRHLSSYDEIWEADKSRHIPKPVPGAWVTPPVVEESASGSDDLVRIVTATVAKVLKEHYTIECQQKAAVPIIKVKKGVDPPWCERFNVASDSDPSTSDDDFLGFLGLEWAPYGDEDFRQDMG
jgi:hypothetical protein